MYLYNLDMLWLANGWDPLVWLGLGNQEAWIFGIDGNYGFW